MITIVFSLVNTFIIYFSLIVKQAIPLINENQFWICSLNQPVLSNERFLHKERNEEETIGSVEGVKTHAWQAAMENESLGLTRMGHFDLLFFMK